MILALESPHQKNCRDKPRDHRKDDDQGVRRLGIIGDVKMHQQLLNNIWHIAIRNIAVIAKAARIPMYTHMMILPYNLSLNLTRVIIMRTQEAIYARPVIIPSTPVIALIAS